MRNSSRLNRFAAYDEILTKACQANLIWIGDYHALSASQNFVAALLKEIVERKRDVALAVEPIFARNQKILDLWMDGKISEQEFLDRIHYYEEWGCDWQAYKDHFTPPATCMPLFMASIAIPEMTCAVSAGATSVSRAGSRG